MGKGLLTAVQNIPTCVGLLMPQLKNICIVAQEVTDFRDSAQAPLFSDRCTCYSFLQDAKYFHPHVQPPLLPLYFKNSGMTLATSSVLCTFSQE